MERYPSGRLHLPVVSVDNGRVCADRDALADATKRAEAPDALEYFGCEWHLLISMDFHEDSAKFEFENFFQNILSP